MILTSTDGLAMAVTFLISVGSSTIGSIGLLGEWSCKVINKENYPRARIITETFFKTIQTMSAALTLLLIGSSFTRSVKADLGLIAISGFMALTPLINRIVQNCIKNEEVKNFFDLCDRILNVVAKFINTTGVSIGIGALAGIRLKFDS